MRRLRISERARRELEEIYRFGMLNYGVSPAGRYITRLEAKLEFLAEHPFVGTERKEVRPPIRLGIFEAHNILYDVNDDEVIVQRILHHSANWTDLF